MNTKGHTGKTNMKVFELDDMRPGKGRILIKDDKGRYSVYCLYGDFEMADSIPINEATERAGFIVTACNSHYKLLQACLRITYLLPLNGKAEDIRIGKKDLALVRQAIESAER